MYDTPGVYIEEVSNPSLVIESGPSAVPVFIGSFYPIASGLPTGECVPVTSWLDFTTKYGPGPITVTLPASTEPPANSALKSKSNVSGRADDSPTIEQMEFHNGYYAVQIYFINGGGPCFILDPAGLASLGALSGAITKTPDISLLVCVDGEDGAKDAIYTALDPLLAGDGGYFLIADSTDGSTGPTATTAMQTAVYFPALETTLKVVLPDETDIALVGVPDVNTLAELKVADPALYSDVAAEITRAAAAEGVVTLPPSAAVAGVYCTTDRKFGVWKAPANIALKGVIDLTRHITNAEQGPMNAAGINAIRRFEKRGYLIWGARTRAVASYDWRYVSVRRLFNTVERDCKASIERVVFEPNSQPTWELVRASLEIYLNEVWRQGGLKGNRAAEAYTVTVGLGTTMTEANVLDGLMIVRVAIAPVRPGEFIVLQFSQFMAAAN